MSEIKRKEKFDNAQLTLSVDMETLHPCGYVYKDGERYPILLGGNSYTCTGTLSVRNKSTNPIFIQTVIFGMECKLVSNCDATNTYECTLDNKLVTLHLEDKIKKSSEFPFTIKDFIPKTDSYDGISTSIFSYIKAVVVTPGIDIFKISIPYIVRFPMPIPPLKMGLTCTCNLLDIFVLQIHLDRSLYAVNDIVTGWVEVLKSERMMKSIYVSLIRDERMSIPDENGRIEVHLSKDQLLKQEIVDTIMAVNNYEKRKGKKLENDVDIRGSNCEEMIDTSITHIPFRFFINEFMGIYPSYSLVHNELTVDWKLKFSVYDQKDLEYTYSIDIDIVRGDIFSL